MKTKQFRLFKRADDRREMAATAVGYKDRFYYFKFTFRGQRHVRCLETNDATEAQRRAKQKHSEIIAAVTTGEYRRLDATKLRHEHTGTVGQLIAAYRTGPSEAGFKTRKINISSLLAIIGSSEESAAKTSIGEINAAVVRRYFETITSKCLAETDQAAAASAKRSANSTWAKARSLFTPRCLQHYRDKELHHACLEDFVRAGDLAKFSSRSLPKIHYNPPADDILKATLDAWEALEDPELYLCIGHELAFGLRIGEMAQARWGWHSIRAGYPVLDSTAVAAPVSVKNGTGVIQVRALDPWYSQMRARIKDCEWEGRAEDYIISGSNAYRTDALFRAVSDWLRQLGWETKKTNHALRAYAGSQVAMRYGIYEAQCFLRHSTVKVTEQHYSHFVQKFKPSNLETITARWAVLAPTITRPVIVEEDNKIIALPTGH